MAESLCDIPDPTPRSVHRWAVAIAAATVVLIFIGGTVTSNDAGLAVPDWPTTFGENMFLYHPRNWVGDVFFEHGHRLAGAGVGLIAIGLAVWTQRREPRASVRWFAWILLVAVIVQGVMGGIRVTNLSITLAMVHGCFAQLFLSGAVWMAVITSDRWFEAIRATRKSVPRFWQAMCLVMPVVVFGQLIAGAVYRHLNVGLAYHVVGAIAVTVVVSAVVMWVSGERHEDRLLMRLVAWLGAALIVQLMLGVGAYVVSLGEPSGEVSFWQWFVPSLHVAIGAIVLALSGAVALCVQATMHVDRGGSSPAHAVSTAGVS